MGDQDLAQAIRDLTEAEETAVAFYQHLAETAEDARTRDFFRAMAQAEEGHVAALEELARKLPAGEQDFWPSGNLATAEVAPGWTSAGGLDLLGAMDLAMEAEQHATMLYDAMADSTTGMTSKLFARLAVAEQSHLDQLQRKRDEHIV